MKITKYAAAFLIGSTLFSAPAFAAGTPIAPTTVTATLNFDTPLTVTKNSDINFGFLQAGLANAYTISPEGSLSATTASGILFGTPVAGKLTISGSKTQAISIKVQNYQANGGVTLSNAMCNYNNLGDQACDTTGLSNQAAPDGGKVLLLGVTATTTTTTPTGAATPTFDVVVNYM